MHVTTAHSFFLNDEDEDTDDAFLRFPPRQAPLRKAVAVKPPFVVPGRLTASAAARAATQAAAVSKAESQRYMVPTKSSVARAIQF
jgi:hypothetical protein